MNWTGGQGTGDRVRVGLTAFLVIDPTRITETSSDSNSGGTSSSISTARAATVRPACTAAVPGRPVSGAMK